MTIRAYTLPFMHKISKSYLLFRAFKKVISVLKGMSTSSIKCIYTKNFELKVPTVFFPRVLKVSKGGAVSSFTSIISI